MPLQETITSRTIHRMILNDLGRTELPAWVWGLVLGGTPMQSNSPSEKYADLMTAPKMQEWLGERAAAEIGEFTFEIQNVKYEATIDILKDWLRYQKLGLIDDRVQSLPRRSDQQWLSLVFALIAGGESAACYDEQYFFDTDHPTGKDTGTTQSNDIGVDISDAPALKAGTTTNPSVGEAAYVIGKCIEQIVAFTDDQGEYMNELASQFLVTVPLSLWRPFAAAAIGTPKERDDAIQSLAAAEVGITVKASPRLSAWTTKVAVFALDVPQRPLVLQEVGTPEVTKKAEGSDYEHDTDRHQHGIMAIRGAGYGAWQSCCLGTMT